MWPVQDQCWLPICSEQTHAGSSPLEQRFHWGAEDKDRGQCAPVLHVHGDQHDREQRLPEQGGQLQTPAHLLEAWPWPCDVGRVCVFCKTKLWTSVICEDLCCCHWRVTVLLWLACVPASSGPIPHVSSKVKGRQ